MVAERARLLQLGFKYLLLYRAVGFGRNELAREIEDGRGKPVFRLGQARHYLFYFAITALMSVS
ncbi:hypothetical protein L905_20245 [Agrobacterium sp. TS43]|nr:hypothetical protein L905_20245 [Agrobacterium sp. TS43]